MLNKWLRLLCLLLGGLMALTAYGNSPGIVPDPDRHPWVQQPGGCSQGSGFFEYHLALAEAILGSPLTRGNDVRLPQDELTPKGAMPSLPQLGVVSK